MFKIFLSVFFSTLAFLHRAVLLHRLPDLDRDVRPVVGDTVGDPFKDTGSVAMNPVVKFTTLFGLLAVELGVYLVAGGNATLSKVLAVAFFVVAVVFVHRCGPRPNRRLARRGGRWR